MSVARARAVASTRDTVAESPWWDGERRLSWIDVRRPRLHSLDTGTGAVSTWELAVGGVTAAVASRDHSLTLVSAGGLARFRSHHQPRLQPLVSDLALPPDRFRTNDATTDSSGRIWLGWLSHERTPGEGGIGVFADGTLTIVIPALTMPNGLAWLPGERTFVFVDTAARALFAAEIDPERPARRPLHRTVVDFPPASGLPDGVAVAADGSIWVALWGGSGVERYSLEGRLLERIEVPAPLVTSCAFGGPALSSLFVTTARHTLTRPTDRDGALYHCEVDVPGLPLTPAAVV